MRKKKGFILFMVFAIIFVLSIMLAALSMPTLYRAQMLKKRINSTKTHYLAMSGMKALINKVHMHNIYYSDDNLPITVEFYLTNEQDKITGTADISGTALELESKATFSGIQKSIVRKEYLTGLANTLIPFYYNWSNYNQFTRPVITWEAKKE